MNKHQWTAVLVGGAIIALLMLVPPWKFVCIAEPYAETAAPYSFVFCPPEIPAHFGGGLRNPLWVARVDWYHLAVPVVAVAGFSLALVMAHRGSSKE